VKETARLRPLPKPKKTKNDFLLELENDARPIASHPDFPLEAGDDRKRRELEAAMEDWKEATELLAVNAYERDWVRLDRTSQVPTKREALENDQWEPDWGTEEGIVTALMADGYQEVDANVLLKKVRLVRSWLVGYWEFRSRMRPTGDDAQVFQQFPPKNGGGEGQTVEFMAWWQQCSGYIENYWLQRKPTLEELQLLNDVIAQIGLQEAFEKNERTGANRRYRFV
jgi:hypothetical protein